MVRYQFYDDSNSLHRNFGCLTISMHLTVVVWGSRYNLIRMLTHLKTWKTPRNVFPCSHGHGRWAMGNPEIGQRSPWDGVVFSSRLEILAQPEVEKSKVFFYDQTP